MQCTATRQPALLVTADGAVFSGEAAGARVPVATGELVFNTAMSGYQEVITDPSYAGQVIAFTSTAHRQLRDQRRRRRGRAPRTAAGSWCATWPTSRRTGGRPRASSRFLRRHGIPALTGVDTRRLARHVRQAGAVPCAFGTAARGRAARRRGGGAGHRRPRPGLGRHGSEVTRHPATGGRRRGERPAHRGLRLRGQDHHGPAAHRRSAPSPWCPQARRPTTCWRSTPTGSSSRTARAIPPRCPARPAPWPTWSDACPVFGICLGHQILATALGGTTYKLPFGHHGANHPVQRLETGVVEITSQNHNYAVAAGSIPDAETTHVNLNDGVIEGFRSLAGAGLLGAVPPRSGTRAPRCPLPLRRVPRPHVGPPARAGPAPAAGAR